MASPSTTHVFDAASPSHSDHTTTSTPPPAEDGALRILVLEDDEKLRRSFARRLRSEGHIVDEAMTLADARALLAERRYGCLVLDRIVPDGDSLELVAERRKTPGRVPVLMLSALGTVDQRVKGLAVGTDDYMPKPIQLTELALRVRNLAAKAAASDWGPVQLGGVTVDRERGEVSIEGQVVKLTPHQSAVLDYLVANRGRMIATEELLEHCWDGGRSLFANPLHSQVTRLRRVFSGWLRIESVRGAGYLLKVEDPEARPRHHTRSRPSRVGLQGASS